MNSRLESGALISLGLEPETAFGRADCGETPLALLGWRADTLQPCSRRVLAESLGYTCAAGGSCPGGLATIQVSRSTKEQRSGSK